MKTKMKALTAAIGLVLASGAAMAESTYGYNSTGVGVVTATARVNLAVNVPKLILLKVGTAGGALANVDTLTWNATFSIPAAATVPSVTGSNVGVTWSGAAPTSPALTNPGALAVSAWSNSAGSTVNCSATGLGNGTTGPGLGDITVSAGAGTLPHPGANLGACAATPAMAANTVVTANWAYSLGGTPATWLAGAYTGAITYTATSL